MFHVEHSVESATVSGNISKVVPFWESLALHRFSGGLIISAVRAWWEREVSQGIDSFG
jgi:hypothetical protein